MLDRRRAVGDRAGQDQPVVEQLAANLEAQLRSDRVARDQRRRDAEALVGLLLFVLDAEDGEDLAGEEGRLAVLRDQVLELRQIGVDESPSAKSEPVRGAKLTLARMIALSDSG